MLWHFVDGLRVDGEFGNAPYHLLRKGFKRLSRVEEVEETIEGGETITRLQERVYLPSKGVWAVTKRVYSYGLTHGGKWSGLSCFHRHVADLWLSVQAPEWGLTVVLVDWRRPIQWQK